MPNLDDPRTYSRLDPSGMAGRLSDVPRQCLEGFRAGCEAGLDARGWRCERVVVAGMGGSAIAGDLVSDLASVEGRLQVTVVRGFEVPFSMDENTLLIACSFSGNTEETLSMFRHGYSMGARTVAVCSGGVLAGEARDLGVPTLHVDAPGEPRSAAVYNFTLLLGLLAGMGALEIRGSEVADVSERLAKLVEVYGPSTPVVENRAKGLAMDLLGSFPVVCGGGILAGAARRWKSQINENAKMWAGWDTLPEMLHNSVEAIGQWPLGQHNPVLVVLRPHGTDDPAARRYRALEELLEAKGTACRVVEASEGPPLAQILEILVLGDFVSYHLAMLRSVDPSPTPNLDSLKRAVAGD